MNGSANPTTIPSISLTALSSDFLIPLTLRRISFGTSLTNLQHAQQIGLSAYLEEQLNPDLPDNPDIVSQLQPLTTLSMSIEERAALLNRYTPSIELMQATLIHQFLSTAPTV